MRKITMFLLALLTVPQVHARIGDYDEKMDCTWEYDGCRRGAELVVDLRGPYTKMISKRIEEQSLCHELDCESRDNFVNSIGQGKYIRAEQLKKIYASKGVAGEKAKKRYFIPLGLSQAEKIGALATASIGLVVFANDQELLDVVQDNKNDFTHGVERFGYWAGREGVAAVAAGSYLMGAVFKNGKLKQVGLLTVATAAVSQTITDMIKFNVGRMRPRGANGDPYIFGTDQNSFVSGHASGAFGTAAVLAEVYKGTAVPYLAYGAAGLVAYARMHEMGHYGSDVLFGGLIGVLSAKLTMRALKGDDTFGGLVVSPGYEEDPITREPIYKINFEWKPERPKSTVSCDEFEDLPTRERISACMSKAFAEQ